MQIDIDFDIYKSLVERQKHENHSFSQVIRELLGDSPMDVQAPESPLQAVSDALTRPAGTDGFYSSGLHLPNGTELRSRYKQQEFRGRVANNVWVDDHGRQHGSASAAASAITGTNVNGLRFWEARRPGERTWTRLELLRER